ncbi:MAG: methyltransferase domain-containing protein [Flavobacteriales bacterium]|nr:methyltransferase domain-containing protein [Flavobacteriales bacterium]
MNASFDKAANNYDTTFTNTVIGKAQRELVYHHFSKILQKKQPKTILEINCGTGEDAIWLAQQHFQVTATDISEKMIEVAKSKNQFDNLTFDVLDCTKINEKYDANSIDLVFSNFGGLNCLSPNELKLFFENTNQILTPKGELVLIIMPKNTLWEQLYFIIKGKFSEAFRRKKEYATANVDGEKVTTYYYNPSDIERLASTGYTIATKFPVGFFIPPSYLEPFFSSKPRLIDFLNRLEKRITTFSFLSQYADHYIIHLQKK